MVLPAMCSLLLFCIVDTIASVHGHLDEVESDEKNIYKEKDYVGKGEHSQRAFQNYRLRPYIQLWFLVCRIVSGKVSQQTEASVRM